MDRFLGEIGRTLRREISRRKFLKILFGGVALFASQNKFMNLLFAKEEGMGARPKRFIKTRYDLVVGEDPDPYRNTLKVIDALGGMELFVKKGDVVVVKPNMGWDRTPAQAANTDPGVIAALVELAYKAGAKRVNVFDVTCNNEKRCYENSGIEKAAKEKGAFVYFADQWNVVKAKFPSQSPMSGWPVLRDAIVCDTFINVPVLKHHKLTEMTLSMKNLMGVCGGNRGLMHVDIGRKLVDLAGFINPELTVIDATRVLMRNGPSGGNLKDVTTFNKVFASTDPALADAYACGFFKIDPLSVPYVAEAAARNYGNVDLAKASIFSIPV